MHGVSAWEDVEPGLIAREGRPWRYRIKDKLPTIAAGYLFFGGIYVLSAPFIGEGRLPLIPEVALFLGIVAYAIAKAAPRTYPFRTPLAAGAKKDAGIYFLGQDRFDNTAAWASDSDMRTHMLIFGSTGSGKTIFLLSLYYQALLTGSGVMFVDGKADNSVWWMVYALARRLGREDDVLVINYLTSGLPPAGVDVRSDVLRRSNTTNPLTTLASEQARSLLMGLMRDSGGSDGGMWRGRASTMLGALLNVLVVMRDREEIVLGVDKIRDYMTLEEIIKLSRREDLPDAALVGVRKYLASLPGYSEADLQFDQDGTPSEIDEKALEQHGYLMMQLTETLADLSDVYGHIFGVSHGDVDFKDVVFNRRILFVMLPSLEADPDRLGGLGKMIVAGIRSALAPALGSDVIGTRREVIEQKPTNATVPFLIILDEYGYYAVKGFAVVAAQARSLGVSVVFAGQDYPSFQSGDANEAKSTVANTNWKVVMKLEDPEDTFKVIEARGGEAKVTQVDGVERRGGAANLSFRQDSASLRSIKRINLRDLTDQDPGQGHIMWRDSVRRLNLCYVRPEKIGANMREAWLNEFLPVFAPNKDEQKKLKKRHAGLSHLALHGEPLDKESDMDENMDLLASAGGDDGQGLSEMTVCGLFTDMDDGLVSGLDHTKSSRYAVGMLPDRINAFKHHLETAEAEASEGDDNDGPFSMDGYPNEENAGSPMFGPDGARLTRQDSESQLSSAAFERRNLINDERRRKRREAKKLAAEEGGGKKATLASAMTSGMTDGISDHIAKRKGRTPDRKEVKDAQQSPLHGDQENVVDEVVETIAANYPPPSESRPTKQLSAKEMDERMQQLMDAVDIAHDDQERHGRQAA